MEERLKKAVRILFVISAVSSIGWFATTVKLIEARHDARRANGEFVTVPTVKL